MIPPPRTQREQIPRFGHGLGPAAMVAHRVPCGAINRTGVAALCDYLRATRSVVRSPKTHLTWLNLPQRDGRDLDLRQSNIPGQLCSSTVLTSRPADVL